MPEVRSKEYLGHISITSLISQSHAKLRPDIVNFCNVMASYGQDMPRYTKCVLYVILFLSFCQHNISFEPKVFWSQISLATKTVGTQNNFRNLNFLEQKFFVQQFFLTNPFGNFVQLDHPVVCVVWLGVGCFWWELVGCLVRLGWIWLWLVSGLV